MNTLSRRSFLSALVALPTVSMIAVACGSDTGGTASEPQDTGTPGTPAGLAPLAADAVRIKIETGRGAFTTPEYAFGSLPSLLITGAGSVFRPGAIPEIFPGPVLFPVESGTAQPAKIEELMKLAADAGLLGEIPDYQQGQPNVTDVGSVIVTINDGNTEYVHDAYALGMDGESGGPRKALKAFVDAALAMDFGPMESYLAPTLALWARPAALADFAGVEPQPTVVPWPVATIDLAAANPCVVVDSADVAVAFEAANQQTLWDQNGATYLLAVRSLLAGDPGCV